MRTLYNEYLTGAEREVAIIIAESDAQCAKLNVLFEAVNATLEANMLAAEAKVLTESGTYDDLTMLYKEAAEDAADKKKNIIASLFDAIARLFAKIANFFAEKFGKDMNKALEDVPEEVEVDKEVADRANLIIKAWEFLKSRVTKITNFVFSQNDDIERDWKPIVDGFKTAAAAGTGAVVTYAVMKKDDLIQKLTLIRDEILKTVNGAIKTGRDFIKSLGGDTKEKEQTTDTPTDGGTEADTEKPSNGGKTLSDIAINIGNKVLSALKFIGGKIGEWLGKVYSILPDLRKNKNPKNDKKDTPADGQAPVETPANGETPDEKPGEVAAESASLFGVSLDDDSTFFESEESESELDALCELFAAL